jgi:hypothetical protein
MRPEATDVHHARDCTCRNARRIMSECAECLTVDRRSSSSSSSVTAAAADRASPAPDARKSPTRVTIRGQQFLISLHALQPEQHLASAARNPVVSISETRAVSIRMLALRRNSPLLLRSTYVTVSSLASSAAAAVGRQHGSSISAG